MLQCKNCGGTFDDSNKYCPVCGAILKQTENYANTSANNTGFGGGPFGGNASNNSEFGGGPFSGNGANNNGGGYGNSNNSAPYGNSGQYNNAGPYGNSGQYNNAGPYGNSGQYNNAGPYGNNEPYNNANPYGNNGFNNGNAYNNMGSFNANGSYNAVNSNRTSYPMKWYKFLIYFALFAGGVINFVNAINHLTGNIWATQGTSAKAVYQICENLSLYDKIFGIMLIAIAALQIYTRFALAGYKAIAPRLLYGVYASAAVATTLYNLLAINEIKASFAGWLSTAQIELMTDDIVTEIGINIAVSCLFIVLNTIYFNKRKSLFRN